MKLYTQSDNDYIMIGLFVTLNDLDIYTQQKKNAPLRHLLIIFNRMNANVCEVHISYFNQSDIDIMKII